MKLSSTIRFADKKIQDAFYKLEKGDDSKRELFKLINQAIDNIEENAFCGIQIPKKLIPKEYEQKYGLKNLRKSKTYHNLSLLRYFSEYRLLLIFSSGHK
jgi:hypothetical protein